VRSAIPGSKPDGLARAAPYGDDARRWEAVKQRDKKADGFFYYAVSSTGVYCRLVAAQASSPPVLQICSASQSWSAAPTAFGRPPATDM